MQKVLFSILFSLVAGSGFSCEIYKGDLSLDFMCLKSEVKALTVLIDVDKDKNQSIANVAELRGEQDKGLKVIQ